VFKTHFWHILFGHRTLLVDRKMRFLVFLIVVSERGTSISRGGGAAQHPLATGLPLLPGSRRPVCVCVCAVADSQCVGGGLWDSVNDVCYTYYSAAKTRQDAAASCRTAQSQLVAVQVRQTSCNSES